MKLTVGIDWGTLTRRDFLVRAGAAAGTTVLPWWPRAVAEAAAKVNIGYMSS